MLKVSVSHYQSSLPMLFWWNHITNLQWDGRNFSKMRTTFSHLKVHLTQQLRLNLAKISPILRQKKFRKMTRKILFQRKETHKQCFSHLSNQSSSNFLRLKMNKYKKTSRINKKIKRNLFRQAEQLCNFQLSKASRRRKIKITDLAISLRAWKSWKFRKSKKMLFGQSISLKNQRSPEIQKWTLRQTCPTSYLLIKAMTIKERILFTIATFSKTLSLTQHGEAMIKALMLN